MQTFELDARKRTAQIVTLVNWHNPIHGTAGGLVNAIKTSTTADKQMKDLLDAPLTPDQEAKQTGRTNTKALRRTCPVNGGEQR